MKATYRTLQPAGSCYIKKHLKLLIPLLLKLEKFQSNLLVPFHIL